MTIVEEGVSSVYANPGTRGAVAEYRPRYGHYIGGEFVEPIKGEYFENISPVNGKVFTEVGRGTVEDIDRAVDVAWKAFESWKRTTPAERSNILNKIADRIEANLEAIAVAETWENGKPVRETLAADIPLVVDHFRYFAGVLRAQEGSLSQIDEDTVAYHFHEPLGVVGQIIPWNFPILMATWKLAPALAAGNCVVLKPAEQTPASILFLFEIIGDLLPAGVVNIVNGFGIEAGAPLAQHKRIRKIAFTGETTTGRLIMQYASQNLIPVTLELGGKSANIFFEDVARSNDAYYDKALEGFTFFALNDGEVCTCPSRALIQRSIYDQFLGDGLERVGKIVQGNPLDPATMIGAQASNDQLEKILSYIDIGKAGRCETAHRRRARRPRRRPERRVLRAAHRLRGHERHADLPGGDLRTRRLGHLVRRLRRRDHDRQRHALRPRRRCVEPLRRHRLPCRPRDRGRSRLDEHLPPVPRARGVRRVQAVRHRSREPPEDARPLPADEEPARVVRRRRDGLLLNTHPRP